MQELINRLRNFAEYEADLADESKWERIEWEAADLIESQAAEIAEYKHGCQTASALVAEMHYAAMGEVVGPKLGVVEDVVALKESHDKYKSLCDCLGDALELGWSPIPRKGVDARELGMEALEAWRAMK